MPAKKDKKTSKQNPRKTDKIEQIYADFLLKIEAIYKKRDSQILKIIKEAEKRQIKAIQKKLKQ